MLSFLDPNVEIPALEISAPFPWCMDCQVTVSWLPYASMSWSPKCPSWWCPGKHAFDIVHGHGGSIHWWTCFRQILWSLDSIHQVLAEDGFWSCCVPSTRYWQRLGRGHHKCSGWSHHNLLGAKWSQVQTVWNQKVNSETKKSILKVHWEKWP